MSKPPAVSEDLPRQGAAKSRATSDRRGQTAPAAASGHPKPAPASRKSPNLPVRAQTPSSSDQERASEPDAEAATPAGQPAASFPAEIPLSEATPTVDPPAQVHDHPVVEELPGVRAFSLPGRPAARHVLPFEKPLAQLEEQIADLERMQANKQIDYTAELRELRENYTRLLRKTYDHLSAWEVVQVARHPQRPLFLDYVEMLCREFREIHGDRAFGDDPAIRCGLARIAGQKVMLIGHHKGRDTKEKIRCMFGLAHPEGYRKALRAMKLAEKFKLPVITLIDTPGAYPGIGAEERGQAQSIAVNLMEMARLRTPIVSVVIGEGGSGGALGIGVADRVAMSQYAWYSVISPEACSSILFKDGTKAAEMADALKLTSRDLMRLGVIDQVVAEPLGGAHRDPHLAAHHLEQFLARALREVRRASVEDLLRMRYEKFRRMGAFADPAAEAAAATARSAG